MMKIPEEVFPKCLGILRKCKERNRKEDQGWYLGGCMADWENG